MVIFPYSLLRTTRKVRTEELKTRTRTPRSLRLNDSDSGLGFRIQGLGLRV